MISVPRQSSPWASPSPTTVTHTVSAPLPPQLPSNIRTLQQLKYLNVARNRLLDVPLELCLLKNLKKLNLERNKLIRLPDLMGYMSNLVDVRVGYNRLEALAEDLFANPEGLIKSLRHFNCSENNLPELPNSICFLDPLLRLEADFNPLISPPPELLKGGLAQVGEGRSLSRLERRQSLTTHVCARARARRAGARVPPRANGAAARALRPHHRERLRVSDPVRMRRGGSLSMSHQLPRPPPSHLCTGMSWSARTQWRPTCWKTGSAS